MTQQELLHELLAFFKALADENRLKIIGLLAQNSYSVENLAETLGLGVSTVSHHLNKLAKAGLVSIRVDGHYYHYSLELKTLRAMAQRLHQTEDLPLLSEGVPMDAYERMVMKSFIDREGRITAFPAQEKKLLVLLHHVIKDFRAGIRYSEKEVNEILAKFNEDTAFLRRSMIEYHLMARESGGKAYWLVE
jgi:predicted transcriptional regulator